MKNIKLIFICLFLSCFINQTISAQKLCEECKKCDESDGDDGDGGDNGEIGEEAEEVEYTAELGGEEGAEVSLEEADMLGTEAVEGTEIITETSAEAGMEVVGEVLSATAVLDAIPVVGEIIEAVIAIGTIIYAMFEAYHAEELWKKQEEEKEKQFFRARGNLLKAGNYQMPLLPNFVMSAEDLDGARESLTYVLYINKTIGENEVRGYLNKHKMTSHISKSYTMHKSDESIKKDDANWSPGLNDHMAYAFSTFKGQTPKPSINPFNFLITENKSRTVAYNWKIPTINLTQKNGVWYYEYNAQWKHNYDYEFDGVNNGGNVVNYIHLATKYEKKVKQPISFWLAKKNANGSFNYLQQIPNNILQFEDMNDKIAVRVNKFDISAYSGTSDKLFISMKIKVPEKYVKIKGSDGKDKRVFPENWNPLENKWVRGYPKYTNEKTPPKRSTFSHHNFYHFTHIPSRFWILQLNPFNGKENSFYYPNTKGLEPDLTERSFIHFQVHDFQPRDTEQTAKTKKEKAQHNKVKLFPGLQVWGNVYDPINEKYPPTPKPNRTNIRVDIPFYHKTTSDSEVPLSNQISFVELRSLNKNQNIILQLGPYKNNYAKIEKIEYHNEQSKKVSLDYRIIITTTDNNPVYEENISSVNYLKDKESILLLDTPLAPGDLIQVYTHYADGTMTKSTNMINAVDNNVFERALYSISLVQGENTRLTKTPISEMININGSGSAVSDWLVEQQPNGLYSIFNNGEKKALAIKNGEVVLRPWDPDDYTLYWQLEFSDDKGTGDHKALLYHMEEQSYLSSIANSNKLGIQFDNGAYFSFIKSEDAPTILDGEQYFLKNSSVNRVLSTGNDEIPMMETTLFSNTKIQLSYAGCSFYDVVNTNNQKFLYINKDKSLSWEKDKTSVWHFTEVNESVNDKKYYISSNTGEQLAMQDFPVNLFVDPFVMPNELEKKALYQFELKKSLDNDEDLVLHYFKRTGLSAVASYNINKKKFVYDHSNYKFHGQRNFKAYETSVENNIKFVAANFDGLEDDIDAGEDINPAKFGNQISVSLWMKSNEKHNHYGRFIDANSWGIGRSESGKGVRFNTYAGGDKYDYLEYNEKDLSDGKWHHIGVILSPIPNTGLIMKKLIVDGNLVGTQTVISLLRSIPKKNLMIGRWLDYKSKYFKGSLSDIKIWKKALTVQELISEYKQVKGQDFHNPDLLLSYNFEEENAKDSSEYQRDGELVGGVSFFNDPIKGKVAQLDGVDDYINTKNIFQPLLYENQLSMFMWMKTDDFTEAFKTLINNDTFFVKKGLSNEGASLTAIDLWDRINFQKCSNIDLTDNKWHQLALVSETTEENLVVLKLYVDATLCLTMNLKRGLALSRKLTYFGGGKNLKFFKGFLDDIEIWSKSFTQEEITTKYETSKPIVDDSLLLHYSFDESNAKDQSIYERDGTVYGSLGFENDTERLGVAKFDGVDDYIDTGFDFNPMNYDRNLSVSVWVKTPFWNVVLSPLVSAAAWSINRDFRSNGLTTLVYDEDGLMTGTGFTLNVADKKWHHVAVVSKKNGINSNDQLLYIDGVFRSMMTVNKGLLNNGLNTIIGKNHGRTDRFFSGYLDDLKIWDRSLNETEINNLYLDLPLNSQLTSKTSHVNVDILDESKTLNQLTIYPNSSSGDFNIAFHLKDRGDVSYKITSSMGQLLKVNKKFFEKGKQVWKISLNDLAEGVYFIDVYAGKDFENKRIVITK